MRKRALLFIRRRRISKKMLQGAISLMVMELIREVVRIQELPQLRVKRKLIKIRLMPLVRSIMSKYYNK
jgi:hypothetical protein